MNAPRKGNCTGCPRADVIVASRRNHGERVLCDRCASRPYRMPSATALDTADAEPQITQLTWPLPPSPAAYYGLAGDFVRTLAPHTEADPVALLAEFLVCFGNAIGRGPGIQIEGNFHATNEYVVLVGETSKARKGTAHGRVMQLMRRADPEWASKHQCSGLVSGEGLIWEVRDPITKRRRPKKGEGAITDDDGLIEELDAGVSDKRLMVTESEFASVLAATCRTGNTLSPVVRDFWDKSIVRTAAKTSPARSTNAHVSIIGHITADELRRSLTATEKANGFANRMMFVCVRRANVLPFGGNLTNDDLDFVAKRVRSALTAARGSTGSLAWAVEGRRLWERVYPDLSAGQPGMFGAVTARAEAHTMRLAVLYALTDGKRTIERAHMEAALALWAYCERSAAHVFDGRAGDELADRLLEHIRRGGAAGVSRATLRDAISHKTTTERFDAALTYIERCMLATPIMRDTRTRPAERWYAQGGDKPSTGDESRDRSPEAGFSPLATNDGSVEPTAAEEARAADVIARYGYDGGVEA